MTITLSGPAAGSRIGPGNSVTITTSVGPTALDDFFECILRETATGVIVCSGSTLAAGFTSQTVFHGLSRAFPPIAPSGGSVSFAAGVGLTLEGRLYHHSFALVDGPTTATGYFWAPTESLWQFIKSLNYLEGQDGSAVLQAVRRTYHNS